MSVSRVTALYKESAGKPSVKTLVPLFCSFRLTYWLLIYVTYNYLFVCDFISLLFISFPGYSFSYGGPRTPLSQFLSRTRAQPPAASSYISLRFIYVLFPVYFSIPFPAIKLHPVAGSHLGRSCGSPRSFRCPAVPSPTQTRFRTMLASPRWVHRQARNPGAPSYLTCLIYL